jgi:hypothetical protein
MVFLRYRRPRSGDVPGWGQSVMRVKYPSAKDSSTSRRLQKTCSDLRLGSKATIGGVRMPVADRANIGLDLAALCIWITRTEVFHNEQNGMIDPSAWSTTLPGICRVFVRTVSTKLKCRPESAPIREASANGQILMRLLTRARLVAQEICAACAGSASDSNCSAYRPRPSVHYPEKNKTRDYKQYL